MLSETSSLYGRRPLSSNPRRPKATTGEAFEVVTVIVTTDNRERGYSVILTQQAIQYNAFQMYSQDKKQALRSRSTEAFTNLWRLHQECHQLKYDIFKSLMGSLS